MTHTVFLAVALLTANGCGHVFVMNTVQSRDELLAKATLVLVGVIEDHQLEPWPAFRTSVPPDVGEPKNWKVLRRRLRVETVLLGSENRKKIDVYEVFWSGGTTGNWNATRDGERAVFPLRLEGAYYRLVQDWTRSIFTITSGPHSRLPLDASYPLWERIALMNWWIKRADPQTQIPYPYLVGNDPGNVLSRWRVVKLERGLLRHPSSGVRVAACRELLAFWSWGQDECWEMLSGEERLRLYEGGNCCSAAEVAGWRKQNQNRGAACMWQRYTDREDRRLLTAMNSKSLRSEFCRLYELEYPGDPDTGCPANLPPPATIVTAAGDVALPGAGPE